MDVGLDLGDFGYKKFVVGKLLDYMEGQVSCW